MSIDDSRTEADDSASPLFVYDVAAQTLTLAGHNTTLQPMSLQAVAVLLAAPGRWVRFDVLVHALWPDSATGTPGYASKYLSYARQAFAEVLDQDPEARACVRATVMRHADGYSDIDDLDLDDSRALLRELIKARRRVGFRLLAHEHDVEIVNPAS